MLSVVYLILENYWEELQDSLKKFTTEFSLETLKN